MKRCIFIIPYFGKFKNYFQLFLNSCAYNEKFNWLILTDDLTEYDYPRNVLVHYTTFDDLKKIIRSKFDFEVSIERPYKLCDYKPTYGYVFEDHLKGFDYWGYCDTDMIFGDLDKFITPLLKKNYDKIFAFGHCTLYKNTPTINRLFMKPLNNKFRYHNVLTEEWNHSFDEEFKESINNIFQEYNYSLYTEEFQANIYTKSNHFRLTNYDYNKNKYVVEPRKKHFFI